MTLITDYHDQTWEKTMKTLGPLLANTSNWLVCMQMLEFLVPFLASLNFPIDAPGIKIIQVLFPMEWGKESSVPLVRLTWENDKYILTLDHQRSQVTFPICLKKKLEPDTCGVEADGNSVAATHLFRSYCGHVEFENAKCEMTDDGADIIRNRKEETPEDELPAHFDVRGFDWLKEQVDAMIYLQKKSSTAKGKDD